MSVEKFNLFRDLIESFEIKSEELPIYEAILNLPSNFFNPIIDALITGEISIHDFVERFSFGKDGDFDYVDFVSKLKEVYDPFTEIIKKSKGLLPSVSIEDQFERERFNISIIGEYNSKNPPIDVSNSSLFIKKDDFRKNITLDLDEIFLSEQEVKIMKRNSLSLRKVKKLKQLKNYTVLKLGY